VCVSTVVVQPRRGPWSSMDNSGEFIVVQMFITSSTAYDDVRAFA